ncbi:Rab-like protein 2A [Clydaea vesicula]|uniref:Rab-like protein 2A n=1 Tax=Clydaea vesicula TaxID=447962 RepID=A0AAD5XY70_9FUNG|nr:Rab-like protein 2A [Clydaea vesicula]KAJ3389944.1 Rab-like protein 2A [Lobulomyces angularis]
MSKITLPGTGGNLEKASDLKIILLGDSAVGKSKLVERFLLNDYHPQQLSTYALTLYRYKCLNPITKKKEITVEIWDTAGQERFQSIHPSYYHLSHCCILCFDVTRKITYKNLEKWYQELVEQRGFNLPLILIANKIDLDPSRAKKVYGFIEKRREERKGDFPVYFCSASDGTNVVSAFRDAIKRAMIFKENGANGDLSDEVLRFIEEESLREDGIFNKNVNEENDMDLNFKELVIDKTNTALDVNV